MPTALGAHSQKLEPVRALRTKHGRRDQQRFAVEGMTLLKEALDAGREPDAVYVTETGWAEVATGVPDLQAPVFVIPDRAMARLSDLESPPGVLTVLPLGLDRPETLLADGKPVALLAGVADPGNAGTLLRSAEAFGIERVLMARDGVEPHNPKVVRASMGALFRLRLATVEPADVLTGARARDYALVATARGGVALPNFRFPKRAIVAVGNERHGVAGWLPRWDLGVEVPQAGTAESLNAAVAGSIVFYAWMQQFRSDGAASPTSEKP